MSHRVLVVDDDIDDNSRYCRILRSYDYQIQSAINVDQASQLIKEQRFDVVLVDMLLPISRNGQHEFGGIELIKRVKASDTTTQVIAVTGYASQPLAVEATIAGAFDFIVKDLETEARLPGSVRIAAAKSETLRKSTSSAISARPEQHTPGNLVANSESMRTLLRQLNSMARIDPLLIVGERGVGKALIASFIHYSSPWATGPFEEVDCDKLSADLVELWGYQHNARLGACARAEGGTLLLKGIEQLRAEQQVQIFAFISQRTYTPSASETPARSDLRFIATTSVDLLRMVNQGTFLEPLFMALRGAMLRVPPLRERRDRDDILALAGHILTRDHLASGLSPSAAAALAAYDYIEGNISELVGILQHAAAQANGGEISLEHLPEPIRKRGPIPKLVQASTLPESVLLMLRFQIIDSHQAMILWESDDGSTSRSTFRQPFDDGDTTRVLRALEAVQQAEASTSLTETDREQLRRLGLWDEASVISDIERKVGLLLYRALTADEAAKLAVLSARNSATNRNLPISLVLRFPPEAVQLAALPWELLRDERQALLVSRGKVSSCVRYIDLAQAIPPPPVVGRSLRLLAICPESGIDRRQAQANQDELLAALQPLVDKHPLHIEILTPATRSALIDRLQDGEEKVDILHFVGATGYQRGQPQLFFNDGTISADRMSSLVGDMPLVILQASHTGSVAADDLSSGIAPMLSAEGVAAVIAMQFTVSAEVGARFAARLYASLARGEALQTAVARARQALYVEFPESWYAPVLYIRSRDLGPVNLFTPR